MFIVMTNKENKDKVRLNLEISPEVNEVLEEVAKSIHGTKSDVLRRGLALMKVAVEAQKDGDKLGVSDVSGKLKKEIIGIF
jgi:predicted transcriptional regulator